MDKEEENYWELIEARQNTELRVRKVLQAAAAAAACLVAAVLVLQYLGAFARTKQNPPKVQTEDTLKEQMHNTAQNQKKGEKPNEEPLTRKTKARKKRKP